MPVMTDVRIKQIIANFKNVIKYTDIALFEQEMKTLKEYLNPPSQPPTQEEQTQEQQTSVDQGKKLTHIATILNTAHGLFPNILLWAAAYDPDAMPSLLAIIANLQIEEQQKLLLSTSIPMKCTVLMIAAQLKKVHTIEMIINQIEMIEFIEKDQPIKSLSLKHELTKISSSKANVLMYALAFKSESEQDLATIESILSHVEKLDAQTQKSIFSQFNECPFECGTLPTERIKPVYNSIKKLYLTHADVAEEILNGTEVKALKSLYKQSIKDEQKAAKEKEQKAAKEKGSLKAPFSTAKVLFYKPQVTAQATVQATEEEPMSIYNAIGNADL